MNAGMHTTHHSILTSIALGFSLLLLSACDSAKKNLSKSIISVDVQSVSKSKVKIVREYIGITKSVASVGIRARVQGFLTEKNFTEGKLVEKDQLLFVIDPKPFKAKLDHAKAVLISNQAEQDYQGVEYQRMKKLVEKGNVAKVQFDRVNAKFSEAKAAVALAKADVEVAEINLSYCYMRAPFSGRIGEKFVDVGNLVGASQKTLLANLVKLDPIYVEFSPSVSDFVIILKYIKNMPFNVSVSLPRDESLVFNGQVDLINNEANIATSTILMRASLNNPKKLLIPGIYVNVKMLLSSDAKQILIPQEALMNVQGLQTVYVVDANQMVHSRQIQTGGQYQGQFIVLNGLKQGEQIVVSNLQKLKPGQKVKMNKVD